MARLARTETEWERNARSNALWAVLTDDSQKSQQWNVVDFFATGRAEIRLVREHLLKLGVSLDQGGRFLDFGCGVGRISRVLSDYFAEGYGVDISRTMIEQAKAFAAKDENRANYLTNTREDLSVFASNSFDFVYSHIVLQHVPARSQPKFIEEFIRVLKPGGVAAFQIPTASVDTPTGRTVRNAKRMLRRVLPASAVGAAKRILGRDSVTAAVAMDMNVCTELMIRAIIARHRCVLLDAPYTNSTDRNHGGRIRFMSREEALADIAGGKTDSPYLSQFFFVLK
jgi:2-polyprenyl-3-methyl-5-hydroxy-6-metoxy-1,4-benzoquinol methylase